jgi:hypothetical protein
MGANLVFHRLRVQKNRGLRKIFEKGNRIAKRGIS